MSGSLSRSQSGSRNGSRSLPGEGARGPRSQFVRFVVGGTANTTVTYGIFVVLSWWIPPPVAYTVAFVAGIRLAYLINTIFVFRAGGSPRSAVRFLGAYLLPYLTGLVIVTLLTRAGLDHRLAMLLVTAVNVPVTFAATRSVLVRRAGPAARGSPRAQGLAKPDADAAPSGHPMAPR